MVYDPALILRRYATTWFAPDLISILPFDLVITGNSKIRAMAARYASVVRLLRLVKASLVLAEEPHRKTTQRNGRVCCVRHSL